MFKRYKSPYEPTVGSTAVEPEPGSRRARFVEEPARSPYKQEPPPRIFEPAPQSEPVAERPQLEPMAVMEPGPQVESAAPMQLGSEEPETTLGQGVVFKGTLNFSRLLRIDGHFEGDLISDGKLVVGPTGVVRSNVRLTEAVIEGELEGNIEARERIELRGEAKVRGDVKARSISVDEGVTLIGNVKVHADHEIDEGFED